MLRCYGAWLLVAIRTIHRHCKEVWQGDYGLNRPKTAEAYKANLKRLAQTLTGNMAAELKWAEMTTSLEPDVHKIVSAVVVLLIFLI